jgi:chromosome segregation ATPase
MRARSLERLADAGAEFEKLDDAIEEMESDAKEMQKHSEELEDRAEKVKSDWRAKQADDKVPGAQPSLDTD